MSVWIRVLWRVLKARWRTWRFKMPVLHLVPVDSSNDRKSIYERPSLCGAKIDPMKVNATIQTNIVGCWSCATVIEGGERINPREEIERLKVQIQDITRKDAAFRRYHDEVIAKSNRVCETLTEECARLRTEKIASRRIANEVTEEIARLEKEHHPSREMMIAVLVAAMGDTPYASPVVASQILDGLGVISEAGHQRALVVANLLGWREPEDDNG